MIGFQILFSTTPKFNWNLNYDVYEKKMLFIAFKIFMYKLQSNAVKLTLGKMLESKKNPAMPGGLSIHIIIKEQWNIKKSIFERHKLQTPLFYLDVTNTQDMYVYKCRSKLLVPLMSIRKRFCYRNLWLSCIEIASPNIFSPKYNIYQILLHGKGTYSVRS
jgi:hypothetical protein